MTILLVQIPVAAVAIDEVSSPDRDQTQILEHLVRYCGKFDPLPALTIAIDGDTARVVRGHKYLLAARALGRPTIRAVVTGATPATTAPFLARTHGEVLDWEAIKRAEQQEPTPKGWHVFYFARPLSPDEKVTFDTAVASLFSDGGVRVIHDDTGPLAEFEARTPVTDQAWSAKHFDTFTEFALNHVPIVSYQGQRFGAAT